ncbi:UDP-N-acetylglucosamine 2-epimerase (non-hydrolyzing) [bacterium]|nr:UDP-N-acetylglucosamine 2-epimerase (non-hydrolyzing) [bacterium]
MKIISIIGARPQFIKLYPLSKELRKLHNEIVVHTGQHYDDELSRIFFDELRLPKPDHNLGVGSFSHGRQTGLMLKKIEEVLLAEKPGLVIVFGDTNSTLAGALAASKLHTKLAHIEAGLRSFKMSMPEEINRVLTDHVSDLLFCPTPTAVRNLGTEGIKEGIHLVGDVMLESLKHFLPIAEKRSKVIEKLDLVPEEYYLLTIHRAENTDIENNLNKILTNISKLDKIIVFPVHPRTVSRIDELGLTGCIGPKLKLIKPVSYLDMLVLEKHASVIMTDSGGVQKEAYWLGVPCLVLRDETEWVEMLTEYRNRLLNIQTEEITQVISTLSKTAPHKDNGLNGEGASARISRIIEGTISN